MTQQRRIIFGPPGTGKTTYLLGEVERCLREGVPADRIAFVSFTRAAVGVARSRAEVQFSLDARDLPWFRTLHSLAYRQLGLRPGDVFGRDDLRQLEELTGERLTGHFDLDLPTLGDRGDSLLHLDQYARATGMTLEAAWRAHGGAFDWFRLLRFIEAYKMLREDMGVLDFTDILETYVREGVPVNATHVFIDEAQDLTRLQWRVVERAFGAARELTVAGDDDQAIFTWSGADVEGLLTFQGERHVLGVSHRLPRLVHALAAGVVERIERRVPKTFSARAADGVVDWIGRVEELDLAAGDWLLLARTRQGLSRLAALARAQGTSYAVLGVPAVDPVHVRLIRSWEALRAGRTVTAAQAAELYTARATPWGPSDDESRVYTPSELGLPIGGLPIWHEALAAIPLDDREYLLSCLRRGERLTEAPRVRISTVHGAKGAEATSVFFKLDLNERVRRAMELDPDAENRVLYVGLTRARERLLLGARPGRTGYQV